MNVLLSVKPRHCQKITSGAKRYEFRRRVFARGVAEVYLYSTSPVSRIVAKFTVEAIVEDNPKALWHSFRDFSGLAETEFFEYFDGAEKGYAIQIGNLKTLGPLDPLKVFPHFTVPQSFCYLSDTQASKIEGNLRL